MNATGNRAWITGTPLWAWIGASLLGMAILAGGCAAQPATATATVPPALEGVVSACDEHGNRVYRVPSYSAGPLAVVGADPTCQTRVIR